jgi:hypothetical protein
LKEFVDNLTSHPFPRERNFSSNKKLGGIDSRAARLREKECLFALPGFEPHTPQPVAVSYNDSGLFDLLWTLQKYARRYKYEML